ncbi:hypothetical protein ACQR1N_20380 [Bradyrhizobium sp. HKCCYLRH1073]|uniref:hypothetical protein n=1 Tax=unclassified Bradyrhizobium TaxID=2631580 RepID=UPI003EBFA319
MVAGLSSDDYALLNELKVRPRTISDVRSRHGADRLVAAGYAISRNLNISSVEYEITKLGKLALVLNQHGVLSTRYTVEPHRHDVDGVWYLKVTSEGNPALMMSIGAAQKLLQGLRSADADDLVNDLSRQIEKAYQYAGLKSELSVTGIETYRD